MTVINIPKKFSRVAWQRMEDRVLVLDPRKNAAHEFNETGAEIWELVDGNRSMEAIATEIAKRFEVEDEKALQDTQIFLCELVEKDLVEWLD